MAWVSAENSQALSVEQCESARRARDPRFDGHFYVAVLSTGIYCRPVCPAPLAKPSNQRFYATAAGAELAGFRPCLRCRPERAPLPSAGSDLAGRAIARLEQVAAAGGGVAELATDLGVSSRHLHRVLHTRFGIGPKALLSSHRLRLAKRLLDDSDATVSEVAFASGFASLRTFNAAMTRCWQRSPKELRRLARHRRWESAPPLRLRLAAKQPFAHRALADFLALRAVPGIEHFDGDTLCRRWQTATGQGRIFMTFAAHGVDVAIEGAGTLPLTDLLTRARRLADLDVDSATIDATLARDPMLASGVRATPGRRVPGLWDPFEGAVRAILGQQVSVAAARTLTRRLLNCCTGNAPVDETGPMKAEPGHHDEPLEHANLRVFPDPDVIIASNLDALGIPAARRRALKHLAEACAQGAVDFAAPVDHWRNALLPLPGIGPWTVEYLCMRAGRDPDAFPAADLVLRSRLGHGNVLASPRTVLERAQSWRPWRAYAVIQIWSAQAPSTATDHGARAGRNEQSGRGGVS